MIGVGGLVLAVACSAGEQGRFDDRPEGSLEDVAALAQRDDLNVLFVLIDTLRADRLGCYGYERDTSPVLDYFARTGLRFDHHSAQSSWTKSSMASLWTGLYPVRTDVLDHADAVSPEARMPAEIFAEAGFATAGIWRNGWVAPNFGFDQGFEVYLTPKARQAPSALRRQKPIAGRIDGTDIDAIFSGMEFLRANRDRRFFLYVHLMDVHQYISTEETAIFGTTYSDAYDNAIRWTDQQVGALFAELYRLGLADRTLIAIASDHGEAFGEHGSEGHARDVHAEVLRTPFILSFPFRLEPGVVVPHPTQNVDVFPTLLELLGLPALPVQDGRSRAGWLLGDRRPDFPDRGFAQLDRTWGRATVPPDPVVGVRDGSHRLIHDVTDPTRDALYDVGSDPGELHDLAREAPELVKRLQSLAAEYLEMASPWEGGAPEIEIDELHLRQLRALGYSIEE